MAELSPSKISFLVDQSEAVLVERPKSLMSKEFKKNTSIYQYTKSLEPSLIGTEFPLELKEVERLLSFNRIKIEFDMTAMWKRIKDKSPLAYNMLVGEDAAGQKVICDAETGEPKYYMTGDGEGEDEPFTLDSLFGFFEDHSLVIVVDYNHLEETWCFKIYDTTEVPKKGGGSEPVGMIYNSTGKPNSTYQFRWTATPAGFEKAFEILNKKLTPVKKK